MYRPDVMARVVIPHQPGPDPEWDYHEWITLGERVRVNRLMISNPRMYLPTATKWICNGQCPAFAFVSDLFIQRILDMLEAELRPAGMDASPAQGVETIVREVLPRAAQLRG